MQKFRVFTPLSPNKDEIINNLTLKQNMKTEGGVWL
jgi:hypothetical protein